MLDDRDAALTRHDGTHRKNHFRFEFIWLFGFGDTIVVYFKAGGATTRQDVTIYR